MQNIDIIPLVGDNEWAYQGWRITKEEPKGDGKPLYALHSPSAKALNEGSPRWFQSQEEALRHLECEVNFEADLVLESKAIGQMIFGNYAGLAKVYSMSRVSGGGYSGEAAAHVLEGPGEPGYLLDPRFDLYKHSPTGFEWGYAGSGPAQLALAILADALGSDRLAVKLHQKFKFAWVGSWGHEQWWMVSQLHVVCWAEEHIRAAGEPA